MYLSSESTEHVYKCFESLLFLASMQKMRLILLLLRRKLCCFLLLVALLPGAVISDLAVDRGALLALREAVRGRTMRWNVSSRNPCDWAGVECNLTTNRVTALRLPGHRLLGQLPENTIGNLTELRVLSLRENSLLGRLPSDLGSCSLLTDVHLEGNRFSGEIPGGFFGLKNLLRLNVARNGFSGNLSAGFGNLTMLRTLYLENNRFTGPLPDDLRSLVRLRSFNVSFNVLTGSIPSSLAGFSAQSFLGTSLCGGPLPPCTGNGLSGGAIAGISIGSGVLALVILAVVVLLSWRHCRAREISPVNRTPPVSQSSVSPPREEPTSLDRISTAKLRTKINTTGPQGMVFFGEEVHVFSLEELLNSSAEVIGKGTVGSTYKAYYDNGVEVIVKRLKNVCVSESEFRSRIEDIGTLVHENLYPLKGYYYGGDEKLLIYDKKHKGSLSAHLHGKLKPLSWETRAKIAAGVAAGVRYLHSISPQTVHGNIKSSNIFLAENYNAMVSEHGLPSLLASRGKSNRYRAPEVVESGAISQKSDVFSYGVVLLELLSGKSPEQAAKEEGTDLVHFVRLLVKEKGEIGALDPDLIWDCDGNVEEKCRPFLQLALSCTSQEPLRRPSMEAIAQRLREFDFEMGKIKR